MSCTPQVSVPDIKSEKSYHQDRQERQIRIEDGPGYRPEAGEVGYQYADDSGVGSERRSACSEHLDLDGENYDRLGEGGSEEADYQAHNYSHETLQENKDICEERPSELCLNFDILSLEREVFRLIKTSHSLHLILKTYVSDIGNVVAVYEKLVNEALKIEGLHPEVRNFICHSRVLAVKSMSKYISEILSLQLEMKTTTDSATASMFAKQKIYFESEKVFRANELPPLFPQF